MRVELTTHLPVPAQQAWDYVQRSDLLDHIAAPLIRFKPIDGAFPERWTAGEHHATMLLFGVLPIGRQVIGIEYPQAETDTYVLRDNGRGTMISRWDHWIFLRPEAGGTRYTDRVDVSAGILTPFVAGFARLFYAHRQRRWRKLAATKFAALA